MHNTTVIDANNFICEKKKKTPFVKKIFEKASVCTRLPLERNKSEHVS